MLDKRILPLKHLWWTDLDAPKPVRMPGRRTRAKAIDETMSRAPKPKLAFEVERKWVRYTDLQSVDRGYITELYNLREIQIRYGLSQMTARYWRQHILPAPLTVSSVKNVRAFYWSRIQLVALDTVLRWQLSHGLVTIRKTDADLLDMLDHGCKVLEDHYTNEYDNQSLKGKKPRLGVTML